MISKSSNTTTILLSVSAIVLLSSSVLLYSYDRGPWPTIGVAALCFVYLLLYCWYNNPKKQPNTTPDLCLSFFLASQLLLAYASKWEPGKTPQGDSPLSASTNWKVVNPHLRLDFAQAFGSFVDYHDSTRSTSRSASTALLFLQTMEWICLISWVLLIGFSLFLPRHQLLQTRFRRALLCVLASSYLFLHGISTGLQGVSHRFFLPAYSFVALFIEALMGYSADPYLCLFAGFTFWSAGVSKLVNSHFTWHTGQALCRYIGKDFENPFWYYFCTISAPASLLFELASPLLLIQSFFGVKGRWCFTLLALSFHFAIALLMFPRYTPQACCYSLLFRSTNTNNNTSNKKPMGTWLFVLFCCILLLTTIYRLDTWPLTAVPMYSTNIPDEFGSTIQEAYEVAHIVQWTRCISDFTRVEHSVQISLQGGSCTNAWRIARQLGNYKLFKSILLRGMADALVCHE